MPAGKESFVKFLIDRSVQAPYLWVWLRATKGISWRLMQSAPLGSCRAYGGTDRRPWHVVPGQYYAFHTEPPLSIETDHRPENVINGLARIVGRESNMWASDPDKPLPQWIELAFPEPRPVNTVYLTFDTDMNEKYHTEPLPPECVRDYDLAVHDGKAWRTVAEATGNFQRRRVHRFEAVAATKLRLTVHATNGDKSARVFEIRAYSE